MKTLNKQDNLLALTNCYRNTEFIQKKDILYLEGCANYTIIHTENGASKLSPRSLLHFEQYFAAGNFVRIHKSYYVNKNHVIQYEGQNFESLTLKNGKELAIARRRKAEVRRSFK